MAMKPILFNTDMVRAILDGRKTVTRRVVGFKHGQNPKWTGYIPDGPVLYGSNNIPAAKAPYRPGDILYVRETWAKREADRCNGVETGRCPFETCETAPGPCFSEEYIYKATDSLPTYGGKWRPSIHMPKEAARLFLRVTDVRVERLWSMDTADALAEGMRSDCPGTTIGVVDAFCKLWDATIKPSDRERYGWSANPWVWVISFERISMEDAKKGGEG